MSTLTLSYSLSIQARKQIGVTPSATSEEVLHILEQSQSNYLEEGESFKISYSLTPNQVKTVDLSLFSFKALKLIYIKAGQVIRFTYNEDITEGSLILIEKKLPTTIPTVVTEDIITLTNISAANTDLVLTIVGVL